MMIIFTYRVKHNFSSTIIEHAPRQLPLEPETLYTEATVRDKQTETKEII